MRRNMVAAGAVALCMVLGAHAALACDDQKTSASASGGCTMTQSASMHGACATKSTMASIFKDAPGTKTEYRAVKDGVALVVTASSAQYVSVVQNALLSHMDAMKAMTQKASGTCASGASTSAHCSSADKASAMKVGAGACPYSKTEQASAQKTSGGSSCCAGKASAASMQATNSATECPDWMKALCSADMKVTKTANGVTITWTSPKKERVTELQAAGQKFQADLAQL